MKKFEYITESYFSNCLIEAVKAKLKNKNVKLYFCKPKKGQMFHFMWDDGNASYDFSDCEEDELKWFQRFLFSGRIRKFKNGFAKQYSQYRNRK